MKNNKKPPIFGFLIAVLIMQTYHKYVEIHFIYGILIDISILLVVPFLCGKLFQYIANLYKKYVS